MMPGHECATYRSDRDRGERDEAVELGKDLGRILDDRRVGRDNFERLLDNLALHALVLGAALHVGARQLLHLDRGEAHAVLARLECDEALLRAQQLLVLARDAHVPTRLRVVLQLDIAADVVRSLQLSRRQMSMKA